MSDLLLNLGLFLPLGLGLVLAGQPIGRVLAACAGLSGLVELAQATVIAGRDATAGDLIANTAGAAAGAWLGLHCQSVLFAGRKARWIALAWALGAMGVMAVTAWSLEPSLRRSTWYGQWAPFGDEPEWYTGEILAVELGREPLRHWRLSDSDARRERLARDTVRLAAWIVSIAPPAEPLRIVAVADSAGRLVTLRQSRRRLDFSLRTRAADFFLQTPWFGAPMALPDRAGDTLLVEGRYWRGAAAVRDAGFELSGMAGWSLLVPAAVGSGWAIAAGIGWLVVLFAPVGWYGGQERNPSWAMAPAIGLLMGSLVIAGYTFTPLPAAWEVAVAAVAVLVGRVGYAAAEGVTPRA